MINKKTKKGFVVQYTIGGKMIESLDKIVVKPDPSNNGVIKELLLSREILEHQGYTKHKHYMSRGISHNQEIRFAHVIEGLYGFSGIYNLQKNKNT